MCGILAVFGLKEDAEDFRPKGLQLARRIRHRGPDWGACYCHGDVFIAHERLAIVDVESGAQPLYNKDHTTVLAVNGEIYNHEPLRTDLSNHGFRFTSHSDCEVILHMYDRGDQPGDLLNKLRGMFAFVIYDAKTERYVAARDHIGIIPLYVGWGPDGTVYFASEMKALSDQCTFFKQFPPGHYYDSARQGSDKFSKWFNPTWALPPTPSYKPSLVALRRALESAVESHMMAEVPYGVLLSGGLDSSLVASIAARYRAKMTVGEGVRSASSARRAGTLPPFARLRSYCVGLAGSPDLKAAREVADFLGTFHREFTFTLQDGINALEDVIHHLETFDVTTIRASTPMYLMTRLIKATGVKMVLSGEGADEVFGGYLYFHKAPNAQEFHEECVRKIEKLHMYDCLRANKAMAAFGVEARVPFLDRNFLEVAMTMDPELKMVGRNGNTMEKHILRAAFDHPDDPYLPDTVLWRQKEQFSDGVGYGWIDKLRDYAEEKITDEMMETAEFRYPRSPPKTKEAYLYRQIFEKYFPEESAVKTVPYGPSIACSTEAAMKWDESFIEHDDPSGRAMINVHVDGYDK
ncbi:asparagine synthetase [Perkinsus olseni]|uniref:asparagine synthase (glutamine-hydrolyzing) n=2 Tax=Perkinsus olseni TaxID=32597 RepID=A0A7J6TWS9_PEROL|nr:asparagine synthetase [Perkinsus olseni]